MEGGVRHATRPVSQAVSNDGIGRGRAASFLEALFPLRKRGLAPSGFRQGRDRSSRAPAPRTSGAAAPPLYLQSDPRVQAPAWNRTSTAVCIYLIFVGRS